MADQTRNPERVRAWVLLKVEGKDEEVLAKLQSLNSDLFYKDGGYEDYVIVRADLIDYEFNVIAPIDAKDEEQYIIARDSLLEALKAADSQEFFTKAHHPDIPHDANAFVTYREDFESPYPEIKAGRIHKSPGANPWG